MFSRLSAALGGSSNQTMAVPTALEFISMWDYYNLTQGDANRFLEKARDFPHNHPWQVDDLKAALKHLRALVCSPNFPVYDTGPAALAAGAVNWITQKINNHEEFMEEYMSFILACVAAGPNLLQMSIIDIFTSNRTTQNYIKLLSGSELINFLGGLEKKFVNNETLPKEYSSRLSSALKSRIVATFTSDQFNEHKAAFVKLLMFYQSQVPECEEHMATLYYTQLASCIERLMGREKWKELEASVPDPAPFHFGEQLKAFGSFLKAGKYPAFDRQGDIFKYCIRNILEPIHQNKTYFDRYVDDVMQLFCIVCKLPHSDQQEKLKDPFSSFFNGIRNNKELVAKKQELFVKYIPMLTNLVLDISSAASMGSLIKDVVEYFLMPASAGNPSHAKQWTNFIAACVTHADVRYLEMCQRFLRDNKKMLKWKDNVDGAHLILTNIGAVKLTKGDSSAKKSRDSTDPDRIGRAQGDFIEELLKQLKFYKVTGDVQKDILSLMQQILEEGNEYRLAMAKECAEFIELKDELRLALPLMQTFEKQFKSEDFPWHHWACVGICMDILNKVIQSHKDPEQFVPYAPIFVSIFKTAMNRDHYNYDSDHKSVFGYVLIGPLIVLAALYRNTKNHDDLKPLLGDMVTLLKSDDEDIARSAGNTFNMLSMANAASFAPHLKEILDSLLENQDTTLLSVVQAGYKVNPKPVDDKFDEVFDLLESMEKNYQGSVMVLLKEIAEHSPKLFTKEHVNTFFGDYLDNQMTAGTVLQLIQSLANKSPAMVEPHINKLFSHMNTLLGASMIPTILISLVLKNKKLTKTVFDRLVEYLRNCKEDYTYIAGSMNALRVMGMEDKEILKPHKELFERLAEKHPNIKEMCKGLINIIEGRSFEDITDKIEQQQDDINVLDNRVTNTENEVKEIGQEVETQGKQVGQLKKDVVEQGERIDELEEVVDETVEKVEEIDKKTLSNAPAWSRDVSILLNPEAEHDWRLLAQRLGYTPEDIRGWATQHDPCMSLLSEWFATHKTSEATKAVLKTLEEMNRLDAAEIVGRAMQAVENVIQDEPPDYETPPPVFISYQWAHQPEARLLRKHLEMAGFESWMDIGQMGGGDKLYAKIDQGIRAAKAVICCVTEKYAQSPNCNREVNLAVNLGKPIIPLLLENVAWPPPGAMGPIFGEYLYIRFFQGGPGDDTKDECVWPATSFQELLMQLSYMKLIPEQSKITKPYKNWWLPPEEVIVVKKKSNVGKSSHATTKSEESKEIGGHPEVFISYQWGIQPQVKALYKRMSSLGYHCWMDIHQMGGGDSLYDKIDRGVRGCKVVLSCVTEKYSKSANCRREVSLSDALKKPIIPLLLEDTTWPPSGPMSMVFTQLLYIDFKDEKVQKSWSGSTFDELLGKIETYLSNKEKTNTVTESEDKSAKMPERTEPSKPDVKSAEQKPAKSPACTERPSTQEKPPSQQTAPAQQKPHPQQKPPAQQTPPAPQNPPQVEDLSDRKPSNSPPKTEPPKAAAHPVVQQEPAQASSSPNPVQTANSPTSAQTTSYPKPNQSRSSPTPADQAASFSSHESRPQSSQLKRTPRPYSARKETRSKSCLIL